MIYTAEFNKNFDRLIGIEGGYTNNKKDPGGETNWGISKRSYPNVDIKALTREGAKEIYWRDFWSYIELGRFHPAIGYQLFDFAVNSGISTATRYFQRALGVADDGDWGPSSAAAAMAMPDTNKLFNILAERLDFMTRCTNWQDAGKGWARRIAQDLRYAALDSN